MGSYCLSAIHTSVNGGRYTNASVSIRCVLRDRDADILYPNCINVYRK
jgi:hypothetical protein